MTDLDTTVGSDVAVHSWRIIALLRWITVSDDDHRKRKEKNCEEFLEFHGLTPLSDYTTELLRSQVT